MTTDSDTKDMGPFYAALGKAQGEMGSGVGKDAKNPHFKSQYATLSACLAVAMPALARHGFALIQYREGSDLVTRLGHSSGTELITLYPLEPSKKTEQGWGSAITYARRYQVMALLGLAPEDDDGNAVTQAAKTLINAGQVASLQALMEMTDTKESQFLKAYDVESLKQLTTDQFKHAVPLLEKKRERQS